MPKKAITFPSEGLLFIYLFIYLSIYLCTICSYSLQIFSNGLQRIRSIAARLKACPRRPQPKVADETCHNRNGIVRVASANACDHVTMTSRSLDRISVDEVVLPHVRQLPRPHFDAAAGRRLHGGPTPAPVPAGGVVAVHGR